MCIVRKNSWGMAGGVLSISFMRFEFQVDCVGWCFFYIGFSLPSSLRCSNEAYEDNLLHQVLTSWTETSHPLLADSFCNLYIMFTFRTSNYLYLLSFLLSGYLWILSSSRIIFLLDKTNNNISKAYFCLLSLFYQIKVMLTK